MSKKPSKIIENRNNTLDNVRQANLPPDVRKLVIASVHKQTQNQIALKAGELVSAGLSVALGQIFIYKINPVSKKSVLVVDPDEIKMAFDTMRFDHSNFASVDEQYYFITAKEPDQRAIEMLLNRAFGKPKESLSVDGEVKFSLRDLGRQADEIRAKDAEFSEMDITTEKPK